MKNQYYILTGYVLHIKGHASWKKQKHIFYSDLGNTEYYLKKLK